MGVGHDGIHAHFLKQASDDFLFILCIFMNTCFTHCYLPKEMLRGSITPVIKDSKRNCTESSNYRPVMQSSMFLKLFECHVLEFLQEKLVFNMLVWF